MKKTLYFLIFIGLIGPAKETAAQPISQVFYAQNYWMPNKPAFGFTGQLESWWTEINASGVKYIRVGGKAYDGSGMWPIPTLLGIIDTIRARGFEPIIQVPIKINLSVAQNAIDNAAIISDINVTNAKNIVYWEIGNEPDGSYSGVNNYHTNPIIADYIKQVSTAMKGVLGQSGIKIIGPCLSYYDFPKYASFLGGADNITGSGANGYYIDYVGFNTYPFSKAQLQAGTARQDIINYVNSPFQFDDILDTINARIALVGRTGSLKPFVTEVNISAYQDNTNATTRGPIGVGPKFFRRTILGGNDGKRNGKAS
ncbi:MAG: hypothetical protein H0V01_05920 [Bacteroidetes bacterium]|nr:hypothetical protein [Bacteroidota bacterium]HET6243585.1 hypothetical protein [Bacteroidia bacterium]